LVAADLDPGEALSKKANVLLAQWLFVRRACLARILKTTSCQVQQGILPPGLAENCESAWFHDTKKLLACDPEIQMVQHGIAPNTVERAVSERQALAISLDKLDCDTIRLSAESSLVKIPGGKIESSHAGAPACQDYRGHSVAAAVVEDIKAAPRIKLLESRANPRLMIQVGIVVHVKFARPPGERYRSLPSLLIVKGSFIPLAIRRVHQHYQVPSTGAVQSVAAPSPLHHLTEAIEFAALFPGTG
jgi:hypothetical protein